DTEGLGVVLVEALSFRTPVVASGVGGIVDVIRHEQTGLLVPERDPDALADAVVRVLRDPHLARALAERGLEHARDYFDGERSPGRVLEAYRSSRRDAPDGEPRGDDAAPAPAPAPAPVEAEGPPPAGPEGSVRRKPARALALRALLSVAVLGVL